MTTLLPTYPYWLFCVGEPISTFAGFAFALVQPDDFVAQQLPGTELVQLSPENKLIAWQTGNLFGIMSMMGIAILWATTEPIVVRNYLIALLIGDIGHITAVGWLMGSSEFFAAHRWSWFTWGNVGFTIFLALSRIATLVGVFGAMKPRPSTVVKAKLK